MLLISYCSWGSQGKNTEVVCHSLLQWTTLCQTSPPWLTRLGWPHMAWLSFIELDKAVVRVIRLTSFLWLWFVCLLSDASCNTYCLTWVSLTLDVGYLHGCSSKVQPLLLILHEGYLLILQYLVIPCLIVSGSIEQPSKGGNTKDSDTSGIKTYIIHC